MSATSKKDMKDWLYNKREKWYYSFFMIPLTNTPSNPQFIKIKSTFWWSKWKVFTRTITSVYKCYVSCENSRFNSWHNKFTWTLTSVCKRSFTLKNVCVCISCFGSIIHYYIPTIKWNMACILGLEHMNGEKKNLLQAQQNVVRILWNLWQLWVPLQEMKEGPCVGFVSFCSFIFWSTMSLWITSWTSCFIFITDIFINSILKSLNQIDTSSAYDIIIWGKWAD